MTQEREQLQQEIKQVLKESREEFGPPSYLEKMKNFAYKHKPVWIRHRARDASIIPSRIAAYWSFPKELTIFCGLWATAPLTPFATSFIGYQINNPELVRVAPLTEYMQWMVACGYLGIAIASNEIRRFRRKW